MSIESSGGLEAASRRRRGKLQAASRHPFGGDMKPDESADESVDESV